MGCLNCHTPDDNPEEAEKYKRMGEIAYMAEKEHEAFTFMRTHPSDTLNYTFPPFREYLAGPNGQPGGRVVERYFLWQSVDDIRLSVVIAEPARRALRAPLPPSGRDPVRHGSSHLPLGFLSDAFFPTISLPDGSNHCNSRGKYCGAPNLVCKIWRSAQDESGHAPSSVSSPLIRTHEGSRDVVLFGVMPEGAVTHPEQLRGTCSHAATGLQGRHEVGSFRLLHMIYEIESSLGYL